MYFFSLLLRTKRVNLTCMHFNISNYSDVVPGYYEFKVVPVQSPSVELIGASGDCVLAFTPQKHVVCALQSTMQVFGVWPYSSLRKYWGDKEKFGFRCGRRAPRGEGEFVFQTEQGEDIFRILERLIKVVSARPLEVPVLASAISVAKGGAKNHSSAVSEDTVTGRDSRPQQPLPLRPGQRHAEPRKRMSMTGPLPPIPDETSSKNKTLPGVMKRGMTTPVFQQIEPAEPSTLVSDTSPAYFTSPPTSNKPKMANKHSPSPPDGTRRDPCLFPAASPPATPSQSNDQDEDLYSHTKHEVPMQFTQRNASFKMIRGNDIYHGLVRSDSLRSTRDRSRKSSDSDSLDMDSVAMYDLAYNPRIQKIRELVPVREGDYESLGDAAKQLRQLKEQNLPGGSSPGSVRSNDYTDGLSFGEKLRHGVVDMPNGSPGKSEQRVPVRDKENLSGNNPENVAHSMSGNPMYNSRDNIFSDNITDTASSIERERERSVSSGSGSNHGGVAEGQVSISATGSEVERQVMTDMERSMVMNPTYSEHKLKGHTMAESGSLVPGLLMRQGSLQGTGSELSSPQDDSMVDNPMYGGRSDLAGIGKLNGPNNLLSSPNLSNTTNMYEEAKNGGHLECNSGDILAQVPPNLPPRPASSSPPGEKVCPLERSDKGYTKIDKTLPGSVGDESSPPPPLPPRLYNDTTTTTT